MRFGGISYIEQANDLLLAGGYSPLTDDELSELGSFAEYRQAPVITNAPAPPSFFVGRDEVLEELHNWTKNKVSLPSLFVVGLGGAGKTALCQKFCQQLEQLLSPRFNKILWVEIGRLNGVSAVDAWPLFLHLLAEDLLEHLAGGTAKQITRQIGTYLRESHVLFVLNGLEDVVVADILAEKLRNIAHQSRFLITSRVRPNHQHDSLFIELADLPEIEAEQLLKLYGDSKNLMLEERISRDMFPVVYERVGGHPLALQMLQGLGNRPLRVLLEGIPKGETLQLDRIYTAVWDSLSLNARYIVQQLCFFGEQGVHVALLANTGQFEESRVWSILDELQQYALLQIEKADEMAWLYQIHNLTRQFVLMIRPNTLAEIHDQICRYWMSVVENMSLSDRPRFEELQPQWLSLLTFGVQCATSADSRSYQTQLALQIFPFINAYGYWYLWGGVYENLTRLSEQQPLEHVFLRMYGTLEQRAGKLDEAVRLYVRALGIAQKADDPLESAILNYNLGFVFARKRQYNEANRYAQDALESFHELEMPSDSMINSLNLRGLIAQQQGDFVLATFNFRQAIELAAKVDSPRLLAEATLNLGNAQFDEGDISAARLTYQQAYHVLVVYPNPVFRAKLILAKCYLEIAQENYAIALDLLRTIDIDELYRIDAHRPLAATFTNFGYLYLQAGDLSKALNYTQQGIDLWQRIGDVYELANAFDSLGDLHLGQNERGLAYKAYQMAQDCLYEIDPRDYDTNDLRLRLTAKIKKVAN